MNRSRIIHLFALSIVFLNSLYAGDSITLQEAIKNANSVIGSDTILLSEVRLEIDSKSTKHYQINDHLVLIDDTGNHSSLLNSGRTFKISMQGHFELVGFEIHNTEMGIINLGKLKFNNCRMPEIGSINQILRNRGHILIVNGAFKTEYGVIFKDIEMHPGGNIVREQLSNIDLSSFDRKS